MYPCTNVAPCLCAVVCRSQSTRKACQRAGSHSHYGTERVGTREWWYGQCHFCEIHQEVNCIAYHKFDVCALKICFIEPFSRHTRQIKLSESSWCVWWSAAAKKNFLDVSQAKLRWNSLSSTCFDNKLVRSIHF